MKYIMSEEKKFYLTEKGLRKLKREYRQLRKIRKSKAKGEVPQILHSEDVNPEYLVFQEDLSFLEDKISELKHILKNTDIIKPPPPQEQGQVALGALVKMKLDGKTNQFKIVGTLEANPAKKRISDESPLGKALMGSKVGETVKIDNEKIHHTCKILKVKYPSGIKKKILDLKPKTKKA